MRHQHPCPAGSHQAKAAWRVQEHARTSARSVFRIVPDAATLTRRNIECRAGATLRAVLALSPVLLGLAPARAAAPQAPAPADVISAYRTVEEWTRAAAAPEEAAFIDPAGSTGACVTLRLSGAVIGRATSMQENGDNLWRAAGEAIAQAVARMPVENDALRNDSTRALAQQIAIDLQIAGPLTPLPERASLENTAADLSPGVDGVAARVGARLEAVLPGVMLSTNATPIQGLVIATSALELPNLAIGDPRVSLDALRRERGLTLYQFPVVHLAQPTAGAPPVFLHRGGRVVPRSAVTMRGLRTFADGLAHHIESRMWPGDEPFGLLGTLRPWLGDFEEPLVADPRAQALAAVALLDYANALRAEPEDALRRAHHAVRILADLTDIAEGEIDHRADDVVIALRYIALAQWNELHPLLSGPIPAGIDFDPVATRAMRIGSDESQRFVNALRAENADRLSPPERAIVAYAWALWANPPENILQLIEPQEAAAAVRSLFREAPPGGLAALMPWLGWAELALIPTDAPIPSEIGLRDFRTLVWRHQLNAADLSEQNRDFAGGVVFTTGSTPLPNWQVARPLAFLATMAADRRFTPDAEFARELSSLSGSFRFLMQLASGPEEAHMFQQPERALGGIRMAPWDQRQPLEASAMALLAASEALRGLEARSAAVPPSGP